MWSSEPREGLAVWTKEVPSFLSYFKTLSIGPAPRIEPVTSCSAVKRSTDWAKPAAVYNPIHLLYIHFSTLFMLYLLYFVVTGLPKG